MAVSKGPSISANTLFHFTDTMEDLESTLFNDFAPRYCLEDQSYLLPENMPPYAAIPMVCFCDVPLSQVHYHTETYGYYCLGLSKEWGQQNGINPIMYAVPNSYSTLLLKKSFSDLYPLNPKLMLYKSDEADLATRNTATMLYSFFTFLKPYEGEVWKDGLLVQSGVSFYNEREWRYVPPLDRLNDKGLIPIMSREQYQDRSIRQQYNDVLQESFKLAFDARDIKYIIVKDESEVLSMAQKINKFASRYSSEEKNLLTTRIISMQQILEDF